MPCCVKICIKGVTCSYNIVFINYLNSNCDVICMRAVFLSLQIRYSFMFIGCRYLAAFLSFCKMFLLFSYVNMDMRGCVDLSLLCF